MQETCVQSLGWEDPLEKEWEPTLPFLPRKSPAQRNLAGYSPWSHQDFEIEHTYTQVGTFCYFLKISIAIKPRFLKQLQIICSSNEPSPLSWFKEVFPSP